MVHINETAIIGASFQVQVQAFDPNVTWTCIGYAANDTFLLVGISFDAPNNRSIIRTFKFQDVKFLGKLPDPAVK